MCQPSLVAGYGTIGGKLTILSLFSLFTSDAEIIANLLMRQRWRLWLDRRAPASRQHHGNLEDRNVLQPNEQHGLVLGPSMLNDM